MARCAYKGMLKQMYLEAKATEMLTVCLHELELVKPDPSAAEALTRSELESLRQAKTILDSQWAEPPTLSRLARTVQLNEYKLKRGFKQLFGMPVYAYVLDRRMNAAQYLLETAQMRVGEVAERVGYSSGQHFTRAFVKRFGCSPSDYAKRKESGPSD